MWTKDQTPQKLKPCAPKAKKQKCILPRKKNPLLRNKGKWKVEEKRRAEDHGIRMT